MKPEQIKNLVIEALDDAKANQVIELDVRGLTGVTDFLVVASGTSNRHVKSLANRVLEAAKEQGVRPLGTEGQDSAEWILVDFADVVVHLMMPETRRFYELEKLWSTPSGQEATSHEQD